MTNTEDTLPDATTEIVPIPGTQMSVAELHAELRRHGFAESALRRLEAARPTVYEGHRQCQQCGVLHVNQGMVLEYCHACRWCRHAVVASGLCMHCGARDPEFVELDKAHFEVVFLGED